MMNRKFSAELIVSFGLPVQRELATLAVEPL